MNKYPIYLFSSIACVVFTIEKQNNNNNNNKRSQCTILKKKSNTHLIKYLTKKQTSKL